MMEIDPVCGMEVDPATAEWKTDYQGKPDYFCAPGCLRSFQKEPGQSLKGSSQVRMGRQPHGRQP